MPFSGFALAVLLLSIASHAKPCSDQEKSSLLRFIAELSWDAGLAMSWRNGTTSCCSWEGIACDRDGVVSEISLPGRGLHGLISPALGDLTGLRRLNLSHNSLSGELPWEQLLSSSSRLAAIDVSFNHLEGELLELPTSTTHGRPLLQVLNISSNLFTGEFPSATWKDMNNLIALNVSNNSFHGWMPSSFCITSPSFAMLDISYNRFGGRIPAGLGNCSALKVLKAGRNQLTGMLPDELFNATSLEYLSVPNNGLYGILDGTGIANLRSLSHLDLGGNRLNGKIPDSIGELRRLEVLHLDHNNMSGELPPAFSNCTNLITIDLRNNYFSGELTKVDFSTLINLKTLDLLFNSFTGAIPESIYSCSSLNALRVADNKLHGQLSPRIVNLKSLIFLSASFNNFTNITNALHVLKDCKELAVLIIGSNFKGEAMPEDETIDGFQNLQFLSLSRCSLSGKIPLWLSNLKNLEMLLLHNNQLAGQIPAWIKSLKLLFHLDISENNLTGEIPADLTEMPMLTTENTATDLDERVFLLLVYRGTSFEYRVTTAFPKMLNLGRNNFTGVIPKEIGRLKSLAILNFSSNRLSGEIPSQLHSLTNLQVLDLSNNHLTGAIPVELNNLNFLAEFNVSNNGLEGPIPAGGQFSTFTSSSFGGNPKLCGAIVDRPCASAETNLVSTLSTEWKDRWFAFVIGFGAFFGVGVLYDQIVLSKYFG
ncbi:receptor-like protein 2 [Setaria italica]|uniref:Leucine-rich repeat-containing N-terminal plant-type domain-containing protein n=1 Tax=Setaria italica TaxID=4555 RepID=K3YZE7_SETIT|nr:receptor-like protein 2 [Setaria italica]